MRKMIFIFVCLFIPSLSHAYIDVDVNHFAYQEINELNNRGIVSGYLDGTFRADNYITEEELITILFNVADCEIGNIVMNWPQDYIKLASENDFEITSQFVTKKRLLEIAQKFKNIKNISFNGMNFENRLSDAESFVNERELVNLTNNVTRAEVCIFMNKLLNLSKTKFPLVLEVINDSDLNIKTVINSVDIVEFDSYSGKYKDVIDKIKSENHPYLEFRNKLAEGNYMLIVDFKTINNSCYQVPTGYDYLRWDFITEDVSIIDAFDIDEVKVQTLNLPYNGVFVEENSQYNTTAFYILDTMPKKANVSRDINTLYDKYTNEYVNANQLNSATINF